MKEKNETQHIFIFLSVIQIVKIAALQYSPKFGDKETNFRRIKEITNGFKADILVLPELFATGYTFISKQEAMELSEPKNGQTANFMREIAQNIDGLVIGGYAEYDQNTESIYNSAIAVNAKGSIENYRKIHLFNKEKLWFSPGNEGFIDIVVGMTDTGKHNVGRDCAPGTDSQWSVEHAVGRAV